MNAIIMARPGTVQRNWMEEHYSRSFPILLICCSGSLAILSISTAGLIILRPQRMSGKGIIKNKEWDLVIESGRAEKNYWKDLWRYRELFYILSWRDIKVRYKQTVLGVGWSVIRPVLTTIIFTILFSRI